MSYKSPSAGMIPIVNVVSYSYKGGSGRSTASVNLAFELARQGKLVVCLDMDIGAPGLHMIISEWDKGARDIIGKNGGKIGHQDFLNKQDPTKHDFEQLAPSMLHIREDTKGSYLNKQVGNKTAGYTSKRSKEDENAKGELLFLFSSTSDRTLNDLGGGADGIRRFQDKYHILQELLAQKLGGHAERPVYIIVDAPNGITPVSLPLLRSADLILMFYRYSLQHVLGTIESGEKLYYYLSEEIRRRYMKILLVGSCVPEHLVSTLIAYDEKRLIGYELDMVKRFKEVQRQLETFRALFPNTVAYIGQGADYLNGAIIEDDILKILEQPLTNAGVKPSFFSSNNVYEQRDSVKLSSVKTLEKNW